MSLHGIKPPESTRELGESLPVELTPEQTAAAERSLAEARARVEARLKRRG